MLKTMKSELMSLAEVCECKIKNDPVTRRRDAYIALRKKLIELAESRPVKALLDYSE